MSKKYHKTMTIEKGTLLFHGTDKVLDLNRDTHIFLGFSPCISLNILFEKKGRYNSLYTFKVIEDIELFYHIGNSIKISNDSSPSGPIEEWCSKTHYDGFYGATTILSPFTAFFNDHKNMKESNIFDYAKGIYQCRLRSNTYNESSDEIILCNTKNIQIYNHEVIDKYKLFNVCFEESMIYNRSKKIIEYPLQYYTDKLYYSGKITDNNLSLKQFIFIPIEHPYITSTKTYFLQITLSLILDVDVKVSYDDTYYTVIIDNIEYKDTDIFKCICSHMNIDYYYDHTYDNMFTLYLLWCYLVMITELNIIDMESISNAYRDDKTMETLLYDIEDIDDSIFMNKSYILKDNDCILQFKDFIQTL